MAFLFGLLLAPVGALIGSVLFFAFIGVFGSGWPVTLQLWLVVAFGAGLGMLAALPVSAIILPTAYIWREPAEATPQRLAKIGAVAGFLVSGGIMLAFLSLRHDKSDPTLWIIILGIALDGAIAGAACGAALGAIMRRLRREPHASPSA